MRDTRRFMVVAFALYASAVFAETKTFNVVARQFTFDITPSPFVVQQGDVVTLNLSAADNGLGDGHGFFMQRYVENARTLQPGDTITVKFTANTAGNFAFACTIFCGNNHHHMFGTFVVQGEPEAPAPTIASFEPSSGPAAGGTEVTISGTNFATGATVDFGDVRASNVTVQSATKILAAAPAQAAGSVAITVTNADGKSATSTALFTYEAAPAPEVQIASIVPASGSVAGGTTLVITGANFANGATVKIGDLFATGVVFVSSTELRAVTPRGPSTLGARDVVITNPDGRTATRTNGFTWTAAPSKRRAVRH